jgi:catechol 2,3-dioxygenase-like lactoylglutathione lyase family enzyme
MADELTTLFNDFDRGTLTRRQLFVALGIATVAAPIGAALGQGSCGGPNVGIPRCNTTPFPPPFAPTGWKTVLMDHFTMQVVDPEKEAAYYAALMGWKVRSNEDGKIMMDIGDWGGVEIRGGLTVPPPAPAPPPTTDTAGGRGGRGGRGGGRGGGPRAIWDSFCWGIAPWDTNKVEAELKKRGLNPIADHGGKDFQSFHVKDPDGFNVQISNGNKKNRRTTPANGKLSVPPPFEPTGWKTMWLDHISFGVTSYKESVAFYEALIGWKGLGDEGSQNETEISKDIGGLLIRGGNANAPGGLAAGRGGRGGAAPDSSAPPAPIVRRASMGHISFGITPFDADKVKEELEKRGLNARTDTGAIASSPPEEKDIHTARYKSYHTTTPNGFDLQISNVISPTKLPNS